jgi:predicted flavoprotein YhiN
MKWMAADSIQSSAVVVVGGGAAGLLCAITAGRRGRSVTVLEHNAEIGRKILISGGGRCNFTNLHTTAANFRSRNPHFAKSALARFTPGDFLAMVERHGIPYHEKTLGQLFCDRSARDITGMLVAECEAAGVRIVTGYKAERVGPDLELETSAGLFRPESLVIASGGLTVPKIGATPFGYEVARQFGLSIVECRPALAPLTWTPEDQRRFDGLDLLPAVDLGVELRQARNTGSKAEARSIAARHLPKRLADRWFELHGFGKATAAMSDREIDAIVQSLRSWRVHPAGTEGFDKAEVTGGGVDTAELSSQTMEARKRPGLYFIGEVVDVTGQLGGFNFQWAWASGFAAGNAV